MSQVRFSALPESGLLGYASSVKRLTDLLQQGTRYSNERYGSMDMIHGESCSGRILFPENITPSPTAVLFPRPLYVGQIAESFFDEASLRELRLDPTEQPPNKSKGFEVRVTSAGVFIIRAVWVLQGPLTYVRGG